MTVLKKEHLFSAYHPQIYLTLSVLCMTVIAAIAHRAPFMEAVSFFLFQVSCVILPGAAVNCLLPISQLNRMENILFSYVWGFVLNIGVYFLTVPFGLGAYIKILYLILAVVSVGILVRKTNTDCITKTHIGKGEIIGIVATALLFFIYLIAFSLRWALTEQGKDFHNDLLFWIGNTIALKEQFLPIDFRALYDNYKYHYFGSMQQAVAALVTDMPVFNLAVRYSFIEGVLFLGLSAGCLTMRLIKNYKAALLTLVLILFSTGLEDLSVVTYIWHMYLVPMSFEIAASFEMVILLLLFIQNGEKKINPIIVSALTLYLAVCTGTKGPSGMIVLCGIGIMCIYWMFVRKEYAKAIIYGTVSLVSFGIVYLSLLAGRQQTYVMEAAAADMISIVPDTASTGETVEMLGDKLLSALMWLSGYIKYIFLVNPWTFVPAILYSGYKAVRHNISIEQTIMFVMVVIGSVMGYHIHYDGDSQMYFILSVCPFAAVLAGIAADDLFGGGRKTGYLYKAVQNTMLGILFLMIGYVTILGNYRGHLQVHARIGYAILRNKPYEETTWNWELSQSEYQAYDWIRQNTETDAVFLSDVFFINAYQSYYYPGVFTERRIFFYRNDSDIEPGRACYDGDESAVGILREKGIDYIIQSKYRSPDFKLSEALGENVFENEEMAVYKLY